MASSSDIKQLKKAFGEIECDDDLVWHSAAGLALQLGLAASELAEQFELFALNKCVLALSTMAFAATGVAFAKHSKHEHCLVLSRKRLGEPITKPFFTLFSDHLKKEKAKENVAVNRSTGASSALCVP